MEIKIQHIEEIRKAARQFIENIGSHRVFAFYGKMGAGKTTFIKAICEELGVEDVITSPTFAIVNEYTTHSSLLAPYSSIYHFDFYRIKSWKRSTTWALRTTFIVGHYASLSGQN